MNPLKSDKFRQVDNLRKLLKSHLPKHLHTQILSFSIKGDLITLKVKHQLYKIEIEGIFSQIENFKYRVKIEVAFKKEVKPNQTKQVYKERAKGKFENLAQDSDIRAIIEDIRGTINETNRKSRGIS